MAPPSHEALVFFRRHHALTAPLRILCDAKFVQMLHNNGKDIKRDLSNLFGMDVVLITTKCLSLAVQGRLGSPPTVLQAAKVKHCLHSAHHVILDACLPLLLGTQNPSQFSVATTADDAHVYTQIPGTLVIVADENGELSVCPPSEAQVSFAVQQNLGDPQGQAAYHTQRKILKLRAKKKSLDLRSAAIRVSLRMLDHV